MAVRFIKKKRIEDVANRMTLSLDPRNKTSLSKNTLPNKRKITLTQNNNSNK